MRSGGSHNTEWLTYPEHLTLTANEVHVWRALLDIPEDAIARLAGSLSPDEASRSERYHFRRDQKRFLAGRGILRNILARYLAAEPEQIVFSYNAHGKPFLCDPFKSMELTFNLSHAHDLALYAVAVKRRVGIDMEFLQREFQWEEIAERFFSHGEQASLRRLPQKERRHAFFTFWTQKEAVLKAVGTGLTDDLKKINVASRPRRTACPSPAGYPQNISDIWEVIELDPGPGFTGALAVEGEGVHVQCWQWS